MSFQYRWIGLLRRLLFYWVRYEWQADPKPLAAESNSATIYILEGRGLSELLVLQQLCEKQSLSSPLQPLSPQLSLGPSLLSLRKARYGWSKGHVHSPEQRLQKILECLPGQSFTLQPVSVFWGRHINRERGWFSLWFADGWRISSRLHKLLTILLHGRQCFVVFSPALKLTATSGVNVPEWICKLRDLARAQRSATLGPNIPDRATVVRQILRQQPLRDCLLLQAQEQGISRAKLERQARRYANEIVSDTTQSTLVLMQKLLNGFWNRFYSGIETRHFPRLQKLALTHQILYLPCHRSHIDYLLLSYLIHENGLSVPYIAAGKNLNIPVIGRLLRGGGAFFIRRSFRDNRLYQAVLEQYLQHLIELGAPMEFFIEGGRSRTGRLLEPKLGMLSMILQAYVRLQPAKPLALVPVYIGYEKLMEGRAYLGELYGEKKKPESTLGTLRGLLSLRGSFGQVDCAIGHPLLVDDALELHEPNWRLAEQGFKKSDWFRHCVDELAHQSLQAINRAVVVNPVNLVATVLLATPRQTLPEADLLQQSRLLLSFLQQMPACEGMHLPALSTLSGELLQRLCEQDLISLNPHPLGALFYLRSEQNQGISYYRNNILHLLVVPSLVAAFLVNAGRVERKQVLKLLHFVFPFLQAELHMPWSPSKLDDLLEQTVAVLQSLGLLKHNAGQWCAPEYGDSSAVQLQRFATIVQPILERYYIIFVLMWQRGETAITKTDLERQVYLVTQRISLVAGSHSPDFQDRALFQRFIKTLLERGYLQHKENQLRFTESVLTINIDIRLLLSSETRSTLQKLLKSEHQRRQTHS